MYYEHAIPAIIFVLGAAFCLWIGATISAPVRQRDEARQHIKEFTSPLVLEFSNACNAPDIATPYRVRAILIPQGLDFEKVCGLVFRQYMLGVRNMAGRTTNNVRAVIHRVHHPDRYLERPLRLRNEDAASTSVQPHATEYFRLLETFEPIGAGFKMEADDMALDDVETAIIQEIHQEIGKAAALTTSPERALLEKRNGYVIHVTVYGDDVTPVSGIFRMDLKSPVRVVLETAARLHN